MYQTAVTKTVLGMQKVLGWSLYQPPKLEESEHKINIVKLVKEGDGEPVKEMVARDITLKNAYENYVGPRKMFLLADRLTKSDVPKHIKSFEEKDTVNRYRDYVIVDVGSARATVKLPKEDSKHGRQMAHLQWLRRFHFILSSTPEHNAQQLDKAYQFIELGCPVEFSIRVRQISERKFQEMELYEHDIFDYVYRHFPHLRPDFIFKSMPLGTTYKIQPLSDGRHVQFVLGPETIPLDPFPHLDLTERLLTVQRAAEQRVGELNAGTYKRVKVGDKAKAGKRGGGDAPEEMLQKLATSMSQMPATTRTRASGGQGKKSKKEHAIPPEIVEANRQRQKEAIDRARQYAEEKRERDLAREKGQSSEVRERTVEFGVSWRRRR